MAFCKDKHIVFGHSVLLTYISSFPKSMNVDPNKSFNEYWQQIWLCSNFKKYIYPQKLVNWNKIYRKSLDFVVVLTGVQCWMATKQN